jgi:hypothetical protein
MQIKERKNNLLFTHAAHARVRGYVTFPHPLFVVSSGMKAIQPLIEDPCRPVAANCAHGILLQDAHSQG